MLRLLLIKYSKLL